MTESKSIIFDQKHAIHQAEWISYLFSGMYVPLGPGLSKSSPSPSFSLKDDFLSQHYRISPPFSLTCPHAHFSQWTCSECVSQVRQNFICQIYEKCWQGISKTGNCIDLCLPNFRPSGRANTGFRCRAGNVMQLDHVRSIRGSNDAFSDSALELVDHAIRSAANVKNRTRTSEEVDKNIETAIEALSYYEMRYHPQDPSSEDPDSGRRRNETVRQRMVTAQEKDESSSTTILNRLKGGSSLNVRPVHVVPRSTNASPRRPRKNNQTKLQLSSSFSPTPCLLRLESP